MARFKHPLNSVKIASPCSVDWDDMIGRDRKRFCGQCELNVFNLSEMTKREAEALINQSEGRLCVRFYRRTDGTILTRDCPVGLRAIRRRVSRMSRAVLSTVLGFLSGLGLYGALQEREPVTTMGVMTQEYPIVQNEYQAVDPPIVGKMVEMPRSESKRPKGKHLPRQYGSLSRVEKR